MALTYRDIIKFEYPNKNPVKFLDNTYAGIVWNPLDFTPNPSQAELDAAIAFAEANTVTLGLGINENDPEVATIVVTNLTMMGNLTVLGNIGGSSNVTSFTGTGAISLPIGNTAQRPTPTIGGVRYNTDIMQTEFAEEYPEGVLWKTHLQVDAVQDGHSFTGFTDFTSSAISFDNLTRTFSISPVAVSYEMFFEGMRISKTGTDSVSIPNVEDLYYFYFDNNSTLQYSTSDWTTGQIQVGWIYWQITQQIAFPFAGHRRGLGISAGTANLLSITTGPTVGGGLNLTSYTFTGTGNLDSDAQISITNGTWLDADIVISIENAPIPSAPYQQILDSPAQIPILYGLGSGLLNKQAATTYPLIQGASRIQYNLNTVVILV